MTFKRYSITEGLEDITRPRLDKEEFISKLIPLAKQRGNTLQASFIKELAQARYAGEDIDDLIYDARKALIQNGCFLDNDLEVIESSEDDQSNENTPLELDSEMLQYILDNDVPCKMWNDGEEPVIGTIERVWDTEVHTAPYETPDHRFYQYIEPIIEESVEMKEADRFYNWRDIAEILSDYFDDETSISIYNVMADEYHDHDMTQADIDEILADLRDYNFTEEQIQEIANKCSQTLDPVADKQDSLESDILTLKDTLDKLSQPEIKEKLINLIDSLNQPTEESVEECNIEQDSTTEEVINDENI